MSPSIRILLIDNDPGGRELIVSQLRDDLPDVRIHPVTTKSAYETALVEAAFDLVITEYQADWGDGYMILTQLHQHLPHCPVIMCTACGNETVAARMMKAGLDDYIVKSPAGMRRLSTAVQRAFARTEKNDTLRKAEQRYRSLFDGVPIGLYRTTPNGLFLDANPALVEMLGFSSREQLLTTPVDDLYADPEERRQWKVRMQSEGVIRHFESQLRCTDGRIIWVKDNARLVRDRQGQPHYYEGSVEDVTRRKQAETAIQRRAARLASLHETAVAISKQTERHPLYQTIVERATRLVDAAGAELYLCNQEREEAHCVATYNRPHKRLDHIISYGEDTIGIVAQNGQPLHNNSYATWAGRTAQCESPATEVLAVPLIRKDSVTAVLQVLHVTASHSFSQEDQELLLLLADQAAITIENVRLFEEVQRLAITDALTGLHNRRYFYEIGEREINRARRLDSPLTALMLDIDRFKHINDTYGHLAGDHVLTCVADRCRRNIREIDLLGRFGGEEFAAVLGDTTLEKACAIAERLRRLISTTPIAVEQGEVTVTVSIGVAAMADSTRTLSDLLDRAAQALYEAKSAGRNCIKAYT